MPTGPKKEPMDFQSLSNTLNDAAKNFGKKLLEQSKKFGKSMHEQLNKAADKFRKEKEKKDKKSTTGFMDWLKKGWKKFMDSWLGKVMKVLLVVGAFFLGVLMKAFQTFDKFVVLTGKNFGTMSRDKGGLVGTVMEASSQLKYLGMEFNDINGSVSTFQNLMGMSDKAAILMATSIAESSMKLGISNEEAAGLVVQFNKIMGLSKENAKYMMEGFGALAESAGVSPSAVMKDIAKNTEFSAKYSKGMGTNILNTAIQAKKLGVSLSTVEKVMGGLLDFENSITKEMEASVLLGRQLNFGEARRLALMGDMSGAMGQVLKQVGGQAAFDRMNVLERMALADAIGVSVTELANFASGADAAAAEAAYLEEEAKAAMKAAQEETRQSLSPLTDLQAIMYDLWIMLVQNLQPAFVEIGAAVKRMTDAIKKSFETGVDSNMKKTDGWLQKLIKRMDDFTKDVEEGGLQVAFEKLFGDIGDYLKNWFNEIIDLFTSKTAVMLMIVGGVLIGLVMLLGTFSKTALQGAAAFALVAASFWVLGNALGSMKDKGITGEYLGYLALGLGAVVGVMVILVAILGALNMKAVVGAGVLLAIAAAIWILSEAFENIMGPLTSFAEVVGDVVVGALEAMDDIIAAMAAGFVSIMDKMLEFADVDAGNLWNVGAAYFNLALALTAMGAANVVSALGSIASSLGKIISSIGDFVSRGIDSLSDWAFGEDAIGDTYVTNKYEMTVKPGTSINLDDSTINKIQTAVKLGMEAALEAKTFTTTIDGETISLVLEEYTS